MKVLLSNRNRTPPEDAVKGLRGQKKRIYIYIASIQGLYRGYMRVIQGLYKGYIGTV